jgi:hypothetical protein
MALTLEAEQRLQSVGLTVLYDKHASVWLKAAKQTKKFMKGNFPTGSLIRRDDVAKALYPILEVNETLREYLESNKLRGKFWVRFFVDLIIDKTWDKLDEP